MFVIISVADIKTGRCKWVIIVPESCSLKGLDKQVSYSVAGVSSCLLSF